MYLNSLLKYRTITGHHDFLPSRGGQVSFTLSPRMAVRVRAQRTRNNIHWPHIYIFTEPTSSRKFQLNLPLSGRGSISSSWTASSLRTSLLLLLLPLLPPAVRRSDAPAPGLTPRITICLRMGIVSNCDSPVNEAPLARAGCSGRTVILPQAHHFVLPRATIASYSL